MTAENKIVFTIFSIFLVYGIQSWFFSGEFIIPIFLNKLFYLLASFLFCGLALLEIIKKEPITILVRRRRIYIISLAVLIVLNLSWVLADSFSTNFISGTFHLDEFARFVENYSFIVATLICFISSVIYFFILMSLHFSAIIFRLMAIVLGVLFINFTVFEIGLFAKLGVVSCGILITILLRFAKDTTSKSIDTFSAWVTLVTLMEALSFLTPLPFF